MPYVFRVLSIKLMLKNIKQKLKLFKIDETVLFVVLCPTAMTDKPPRRVHQGNHLHIEPSLPSVSPVLRIIAGQVRPSRRRSHASSTASQDPGCTYVCRVHDNIRCRTSGKQR